MRYWQWFWTVSLVIAGTSFAAITVVVTVRGFADLREMFKRLLQQKDRET
jgi:CDP-diglyceride synthetase